MRALFYQSLFKGEISRWDVSNVINMQDMFSCSVFNGDISKWNTSSVQVISDMFSCSTFNKDISKWNTSNVISIGNFQERQNAINVYHSKKILESSIKDCTLIIKSFKI